MVCVDVLVLVLVSAYPLLSFGERGKRICYCSITGGYAIFVIDSIVLGYFPFSRYVSSVVRWFKAVLEYSASVRMSRCVSIKVRHVL